MSRSSTVILSTLALTVAVATAAAAAPDKVGIFKKYATHFYEDANGNLIYDGAQNGDHVYQFYPFCCLPYPMRPIVGDWDGDGYDELGITTPWEYQGFEYSAWEFDNTGNNHPDDPGDNDFLIGRGSDLPVVGDWDGDGRDAPGAFRPATARFVLYNEWGGQIRVTVYGEGTDRPVAGDWDGNGVDEIGVFRPSQGRFYLDTNGNGVLDPPDAVRVFGVSEDLPIIGDWNDDGIDDIGVWRPSQGRYYLDFNGNGVYGPGDRTAVWGSPNSTDQPIAGRWRP